MSAINRAKIGAHLSANVASVDIGARRVLLLEDETLTRLLLAEMLTKAGFDVVACANSQEAITAFKKCDPDALIFDINLDDGTSGIDLMRSLLLQAPYMAGVLLSNFSIAPDKRATDLKDIAYLRKCDLIDQTILLDTLEQVLSNSVREEESAAGQLTPLDSLSSTQLDVLRYIAEGLTNQEIARRRETSLRAIEQVVNRLFASLGIKSDPTSNPRILAARLYISSLGMPEAKR